MMNTVFNLIGSRGRPAFSPASLSGIAPSIQVALQRQSGLLWKDDLKTAAATANLDPVRVATCPFTGVDWVAPSDSARPTLTDLGGDKWSLTFDGVDDLLSAGDLSALFPAAGTFAAGVNHAGSAGDNREYFQTEGVDSYSRLGDIASFPAGFRTNRVESQPVIPRGQWNTITTRSDKTVWTRRLDGVQDVTVAAAFSSGNSFLIGGEGTSPKFLAGQFVAGIFVASYLSGADLANLESYIGALKP